MHNHLSNHFLFYLVLALAGKFSFLVIYIFVCLLESTINEGTGVLNTDSTVMVSVVMIINWHNILQADRHAQLRCDAYRDVRKTEIRFGFDF